MCNTRFGAIVGDFERSKYGQKWKRGAAGQAENKTVSRTRGKIASANKMEGVPFS
jgi:hypothetical protein